MKHFQFINELTQLSNAIEGTYDFKLVLLSLFVASFASYAAFFIADNIDTKDKMFSGKGWLFIGSVMLGFGVWAMHFIAMLAFDLNVPISYDLQKTMFSVLPAICASFIFLHSPREQNAAVLILLKNAFIMGAGIGLMHYIGMAAMHGAVTMQYSFPLFFLSIIVAVTLSFITLKLKIWTAKRSFVLFKFDWRLLFSAVTMGSTIAAMHYTGMAATHFFIDNTVQTAKIIIISPNVLAWSIGSIFINIVFMFLLVYQLNQTDKSNKNA